MASLSPGRAKDFSGGQVDAVLSASGSATLLFELLDHACPARGRGASLRREVSVAEPRAGEAQVIRKGIDEDVNVAWRPAPPRARPRRAGAGQLLVFHPVFRKSPQHRDERRRVSSTGLRPCAGSRVSGIATPRRSASRAEHALLEAAVKPPSTARSPPAPVLTPAWYYSSRNISSICPPAAQRRSAAQGKRPRCSK